MRKFEKPITGPSVGAVKLTGRVQWQVVTMTAEGTPINQQSMACPVEQLGKEIAEKLEAMSELLMVSGEENRRNKLAAEHNARRTREKLKKIVGEPADEDPREDDEPDTVPV